MGSWLETLQVQSFEDKITFINPNILWVFSLYFKAALAVPGVCKSPGVGWWLELLQVQTFKENTKQFIQDYATNPNI